MMFLYAGIDGANNGSQLMLYAVIDCAKMCRKSCCMQEYTMLIM